MKKFLTLWATPISTIFLILLNLKVVEDELKVFGRNSPLYIGLSVAFLTLVSQYFTVVSPYKRYERWARNKWFILNNAGKALEEKYAKVGFKVNLNIMTPRFRMFYFINPRKKDNSKRKFSFAGWVFKVIWNLGSTKVNKELAITTKQGVCSKAYKTGNIFGYEFVTKSPNIFNFSAHQKSITKKLKVVVSCPIWVTEDGADQQSGKIVGVLNFESESEGSEILITNESNKEALFSDLLALSTICSKLM